VVWILEWNGQWSRTSRIARLSDLPVLDLGDGYRQSTHDRSLVNGLNFKLLFFEISVLLNANC